jgi:Na+-driven multidrug efflux pump
MVTKRHLGLFLLAVGLTALIAILTADMIGAGRHHGVGPVQQLALAAAALITILGVSLIPFGDRPA